MDPQIAHLERKDKELREFVGGLATQMLKEGLLPSAKQIRRRLGGGDLIRINEHLSDWLKHLSGHANAAADDVSMSAAAERRAMARTLERMELTRDDINNSVTALVEVFFDRRYHEALLKDLREERLAIEKLLERLETNSVRVGAARLLECGGTCGDVLTPRMSRLMKLGEEMQQSMERRQTSGDDAFSNEPKKGRD